MSYNIYVKHEAGAFNIINLLPEKIQIIVRAYKRGNHEFTISGTTYNWGNLKEIQIFEHPKNMTEYGVEKYCKDHAGWETGYGYLRSPIISKKLLEMLGLNVTEDFLHDMKFGEEAVEAVKVVAEQGSYIHPDRIHQLKELKSNDFDFQKLITLCEELNAAWNTNSIFTTGLLLRSIINHVPPVFNNQFTTFAQVVANYSGGKSFKEAMDHLEQSCRKIADAYTHERLRAKESLPTVNQVDFRPNLDLLLGEIVRITS